MSDRGTGAVTSVRGGVVEVRFTGGIPELERRLEIGTDPPVPVAVMSHLGPDLVRGIALAPTRGVARGTPVVDTARHFAFRSGRVCSAA